LHGCLRHSTAYHEAAAWPGRDLPSPTTRIKEVAV